MIFCIRKPQVSILLFSCLSTRGSSAFLGQTCCSSTLISPRINRAFFHSTTSLHKHHQNSPMRGVKKENLPSKTCVTCGRPFTWRKKWERVWDEVTTCSKSCNWKRREANRSKLSKPASDKGNNMNHEEGAASSGSEFIFERQRPSEEAVFHNDCRQDRSMANDAMSRAGSQEEHMNDKKKPTGGYQINHYEIVPDEITSMTSEEMLHVEAGGSDDEEDDHVALKKALRKAEKKVKKAARRAQRQGRGDPSAGQKQCDMCEKSVNLLVRCMYEPNQVDWKMICGKCWHVASGGVVDGDAEHPHYRYGGLWKNRRAQN